MAGKTIKQLIAELSETRMRLAVWEEVKALLSYYTAASGDDQPEKTLVMEDGSPVDPELIEEILTEIDAEIVDDLHKRVKKIEKTEVGGGGPRKKSKPARKSSR